MNPWQEMLVFALAIFALLTILSAVRRNRKRTDLEFSRKLETILQPSETIKVLCPQKRGNCILTSKRLLFERSGNFTAVPLKEITSVQGVNAAGKRTTSVAQMTALTVKAEKEHRIRNSSPEFADLARQLTDKVKKQNEKKKAAKKTTSKKQTP